MQRHFEDSFRSKLIFFDQKLPTESRFTAQSTQQFQAYIRTTTRKICEMKFISQQTLDVLRTIHLLHNLAKTYLDHELCINELEDRISTVAELEQAITSDFCR